MKFCTTKIKLIFENGLLDVFFFQHRDTEVIEFHRVNWSQFATGLLHAVRYASLGRRWFITSITHAVRYASINGTHTWRHAKKESAVLSYRAMHP